MNKKALQAAGGIIMFFLFWEIISLLLCNDVLPEPLAVVIRFAALFPGELKWHFLFSFLRVLISILLALLTALPLGIFLGQFKKIGAFFSPLISLIYPIPKIVFLPVFYILLGINEFAKIFLISIILFFQILVVVRDRAAGIPEELLMSVRSLGAGRSALYFFVYIPATVPAALTALRVSVGTAFAVLFIAEQSLTRYGLGYFIVVRTFQANLYTDMFAGILGISLLGLLFYFCIDIAGKKLSVPGEKADG